MPKIKISQLPAKAANLAATDLLEVSEVSGLTYVSKKITGAELVGNRVPYTGATSDVDLGEYELKAGQIELDQSPTGTAGVAVTRWNDSIGLTETTLKGGSVIIKNGVDLVARVVNKVSPNTTLTKAAYSVVKISGAQGQRLAVDYAQANNDNNSADTLGVVTETIATNQEGFIMTVGQLEGVNTSGSLQGETWLDGDVLYLSPTVPGAVTKVKPTGATGHIVVIGYVEYAHAINGKIYVKIMNGWELDELHNVYINQATLANNDALIYESSTQLWKNKPVTETIISLSDVTTNDVSITKHGFAPKLPNDASKFLDGTGNYTSPPTGLTVGTTAVTSGTNGRVFFQEGGVVQQDANFTFDNTLKRLTLKAVNTGAGDIPFAVQNSAGTANIMQVAGDNKMTFLSSGGKIIFSQDTVGQGSVISLRRDFSNQEIIRLDGTNGGGITINPLNDGSVKSVAIGSVANGLSMWTTGLTSHNFQIKNSFHNLFHVVGDTSSATATFRIGTIASNTNFFNVHGRNAGGTGLTTNPVFTINSSGTVGIGTEASTPGARLDVRAQGALSTDIAFRVRNSADTLNTFQLTGDGKTRMQGSVYYTEFDPANGLYVGSNFGNHINLSGVLQGTSWFNAGADGKLAVGRTGANYRFHVNSSTTNSNIPACFNNENNDVNGQNGIAFTTTWTGSAFGNIGGVLNMKHTHLGGNGALQNCQFDFNLNYNNSAPTTRASITGRSNILIGTPTENTADSHTIYIPNGTAPTTSVTDGYKQYSADITAGNAAPHFRTESGDVIKLYKNAAITTPQGIADALTNLGVLTASTIAPSVQSVVSAATVTPVNGNDLVKITAQAAALTLANPTGVWPEGKDLMIRIKDDGLGARAITWDTNYRAIGVTLPTTTVLGKTTYVGVIYNSDDAKWDVIGLSQQS